MDGSATIRLAALTIPRQDHRAPSSAVAALAQTAEVTDEVVMAQIRDGSREALAILFRRYARLVRTIAMRVLRDTSEADDLLQDVFLFVDRNCSTFDSSKASLRSWVVQMTYHRAIDRKRYLNSRHFYTRLDVDVVADIAQPHSHGRGEETHFDSLVGNTTIQALLDALTEDQRSTLTLHFFEGYTFAEIASRLNQSPGNIRNHYYRGLDKLRKQVSSSKLPGRNGGSRK
jgi:RNA polymerase sigma-70 factor, ECF subfamily